MRPAVPASELRESIAQRTLNRRSATILGGMMRRPADDVAGARVTATGYGTPVRPPIAEAMTYTNSVDYKWREMPGGAVSLFRPGFANKRAKARSQSTTQPFRTISHHYTPLKGSSKRWRTRPSSNRCPHAWPSVVTTNTSSLADDELSLPFTEQLLPAAAPSRETRQYGPGPRLHVEARSPLPSARRQSAGARQTAGEPCYNTCGCGVLNWTASRSRSRSPHAARPAVPAAAAQQHANLPSPGGMRRCRGSCRRQPPPPPVTLPPRQPPIPGWSGTSTTSAWTTTPGCSRRCRRVRWWCRCWCLTQGATGSWRTCPAARRVRGTTVLRAQRACRVNFAARRTKLAGAGANLASCGRLPPSPAIERASAPWSRPCPAALERAVESLRASLRERGSDLVVRVGERNQPCPSWIWLVHLAHPVPTSRWLRPAAMPPGCLCWAPACIVSPCSLLLGACVASAAPLHLCMGSGLGNPALPGGRRLL
jgi:hypothetical protein